MSASTNDGTLESFCKLQPLFEFTPSFFTIDSSFHVRRLSRQPARTIVFRPICEECPTSRWRSSRKWRTSRNSNLRCCLCGRIENTRHRRRRHQQAASAVALALSAFSRHTSGQTVILINEAFTSSSCNFTFLYRPVSGILRFASRSQKAHVLGVLSHSWNSRVRSTRSFQ